MKIIDISKCNEEVISYINELQNKYAELDKLNKELDKSNITIFEENNHLIKENKRLNNIINEALEYIESYINQFNGVYPTADMRYLDLHKLLGILKGSDKE